MRKIAWTPEVVVSPEESGGLVTSNGRPNRNIPGTIYYISDTELRGYDLSRGTLEVTNLDTSGIQEAFRFNDLALSDLGQTLAVLDKESYDTTVLRFFSASGNLINSIDASDLVTNAQAFSLQYSPADSNLIAFSYRIIGENNAIAIYDIERERLVDSIYLQNHASVFTWAPDGSLLATDNNLIYRYALLSSGFAAPELLLTLPEVPHSFRVRGSDNRIVYSALGKIYTVGLDGTGLGKVAESVSGESLSSPSWSLGGRYILFKATHFSRQDDLVMVAGDARSVLVRDTIDNQPGYLRLGENGESPAFQQARGAAVLR